MLKIHEETGEIVITRGDAGIISVSIPDYVFKKGETVRFKVFKDKDCGCVELQKDVEVQEDATELDIELTKEDTKIGKIINKPTTYWYEVELNPDTHCQTIIGYTTEEGAKIFTLLPEGGDKE